MTLAEILPSLLAGKTVKQRAHVSLYRMASHYLERRNTCRLDEWMREPLDREMALATDWELVDEPRTEAPGLRHDCGEKCMKCAQPHPDTLCRCCGEADDPDGPGPAINTGFCEACTGAGCPEQDVGGKCIVTGVAWVPLRSMVLPR